MACLASEARAWESIRSGSAFSMAGCLALRALGAGLRVFLGLGRLRLGMQKSLKSLRALVRAAYALIISGLVGHYARL